MKRGRRETETGKRGLERERETGGGGGGGGGGERQTD